MLGSPVKAPGTRPAPPIVIERDYSRHPMPGQLALWLAADARGDRAPVAPFTAYVNALHSAMADGGQWADVLSTLDATPRSAL